LARGPYGWGATCYLCYGLLILIVTVVVRDERPRTRASSFAVVLLALLGAALMLAAFRVDMPDDERW
jgi:hypothetical protein